MPLTWTAAQILALAPDASAASSGKQLANTAKWRSLGHDEQAAWGECQGSGKDPYQTIIDLAEPAFRCSCPSRKFPCKHGLGLFLILAVSPQAMKETAPPAWVTAWITGRAKRAQAAPKKDAPPDPAARAKRDADRQGKVAAGLADLARWLRDIVRHGLAETQAQPYRFWDTPAARLVDAQAPGVARLVRDLAGIPASGEGWPDRLLEQLGKLHLLLEGFQRLDTLPPAAQADIRTLIGWTQAQEELLAAPGTRDRWLILGQQLEEDGKLRVQRTWLWGAETERGALVLDFAHGNSPLDKSLVPGTALDADLVFYPSAYPLRALVGTRHAVATPVAHLPGYPTISAALDAYATALSQNPWVDLLPLALEAVVPARLDDRWALHDTAGHLLPLPATYDRGWHLLALSGGHPVTVFGEWDGDVLRPLSVWAAGRFVLLGSPNS
ncbi:MAG TPA: SWIM zinc finger family protein [Chloroflexia bacterium]|nr:SWIM zinc finger family protein [Chloroflexia bacterium]